MSCTTANEKKVLAVRDPKEWEEGTIGDPKLISSVDPLKQQPHGLQLTLKTA